MFGQWSQSILVRTTLVILGAVGLAGLIFIFLAAGVTASDSEDRAKIHLSQLLDTVESSVRAACYVNDRALAREIAVGLLKNNDVLSVKILASNLVLAQETHPGLNTRQVNRESARGIPIHRKIISPFDNTEIVGEIIVTPNRIEIESQSSQSVWFIVMLLGSQLLVIAAIVLPSVLYLVSRPIKKLSDTLHELDPASGDLLLPPTGHEHDEIGRLVSDINALTGRFLGSLHHEQAARETIENTEQALTESELRYRTIFESAGDAIFLIRDNIYIDCNDSTLELYGCQRSDIIGCTPYRYSPEYQPDGSLSSKLAEEKANAASAGETQLFDWEHCRLDGTCFSAEVRLKLIKLHQGTYLQAIVRDITTRKNTERMLANAKEEAEKTTQAKSAFLASMSHELRTPLNAIIGFAQMLDMGIPVPLALSQKQPVRHILSSGRHLLGLINEVLDLTRIEAGRMDISASTVAVTPLIENIIALVQPGAAERRINIQYSSHSEAKICADPVRVRQILLNLLSNAIKYNRDDGLVLVSCQEKNNVVNISISDTGSGIPKQQHVLLFQPFQRLGAEYSITEGTGIGLVICKKLTEAMNGRIGFESKEGIGSRFWVELPAATASHINVAPEIRTVDAPKNSQVHGIVLYVEDSPVNASVMEHIFSHLTEVQLIIAATAEAGLDIIHANPPDLVLMDINLPGMNGLDALLVIKSDPYTASIPVIAVSAAALPQDVKRGLEAGFSAYLTKPFEVTELITMVAKILGNDRRR